MQEWLVMDFLKSVLSFIMNLLFQLKMKRIIFKIKK